MFAQGQEGKDIYQMLKAQKLCVECRTKVITRHVRCPRCRKRRAKTSEAWRIKQILKEES